MFTAILSGNYRDFPFTACPHILVGFPGDAVVKNPSVNVGDTRDAGSIPGSGRSPGGVHGNPLQHSCLERTMDKGAWRATGHEVARVRYD